MRQDELGGEKMTVANICRDLIEKSSLQQKDVAEAMGWSQGAFSNRLRRNSLSAEEFLKLIGILGFDFKIVEKKTNEEIRTRRKGVGERLQMMVNGVKYDTYKADAICHSDENDDMFFELYQDSEGRYFVAQYVRWKGGVSSISPIGAEDAKRLMNKLK